MALRIIIKDFEIIEDAKLVVDGLVALVGESNNGKTAVYNAVKVAAYNIQGQNYIRRVNGSPIPSGCKVGLMLEDTNIVSFEKSGSPVYRLKTPSIDTVFDKAGRGPTPDAVAEVLNVTPIDLDKLPVNLNFVDQLSEPLINKLSEYQMYKIAVKSFDGEKIQEAIALCKTDKEAKATDLKVKETEIEVQKRLNLSIIEQINNFAQLSDIEAVFPHYVKATTQLPVVVDLSTKREALRSEISNKALDIVKFEKLSSVVSDMQVYLYNFEELRFVKDALNSRESIIATANLATERLGYMVALAKLNEEVSVYNKAVDKLGYLSEVLERRNNIVKRQQELSSSIQVLNLDSLNSSLEAYNKSALNLARLVEVDSSRKTLVSRIGELTSKLETLSTIPDLELHTKKSVALNVFTTALNSREAYKRGLLNLENTIRDLDVEIKEVQYMIDNNICPSCGQVVKQEEHNH